MPPDDRNVPPDLSALLQEFPELPFVTEWDVQEDVPGMSSKYVFLRLGTLPFLSGEGSHNSAVVETELRLLILKDTFFDLAHQIVPDLPRDEILERLDRIEKLVEKP